MKTEERWNDQEVANVEQSMLNRLQQKIKDQRLWQPGFQQKEWKKLKAFLIPVELILDNGTRVGVEPKYLPNLTVL